MYVRNRHDKVVKEKETVDLISQLIVTEVLRKNKDESSGITKEDLHASECIAHESKEAHAALFGGLACCRIKVAGMDRQDLNGRQGTLRHWDADQEKFCVGLDTKKEPDSEVHFLSPENLEAVSAPRPAGKDKKAMHGYNVNITDLFGRGDEAGNGCQFKVQKSTIESLRSAKSIEAGLKAFRLEQDKRDRQSHLAAEEGRRQYEEERKEEETDRKRRAERRAKERAERKQKRDERQRKKEDARRARYEREKAELEAKYAEQEAYYERMMAGAKTKLESLQKKMVNRRRIADACCSSLHLYMISCLASGTEMSRDEFFDEFFEIMEERLGIDRDELDDDIEDFFDAVWKDACDKYQSFADQFDEEDARGRREEREKLARESAELLGETQRALSLFFVVAASNFVRIPCCV